MYNNRLHTVDGSNPFVYDNNGNIRNYKGKNIEYSVFDKPTRISAGGHVTQFKYGTGRSRYQRLDQFGDGSFKTTRYIGSVEKIAHSDGKQEIKRYLPGGAVITIEKANNELVGETIHYLHKDHLGSVDMVTDALGDIVQEMSFDLWGKRRDATDWSQMTLIELVGFNSSITTRAYTGHEALDEVGLIHMNGRIYDPILARFVQADPFIDGVTNTQGYARYTYLKNNPLNATDPSGFFLDKLGDSIEQFGNWVSNDPVAQAVITIAVCATPGVNAGGCAAFAAGFSATTTYIATGDFGQALKAGALSAMSSFAFAQIGLNFNGTGLEGGWQHILAHATTGGVMSVLQGGKFGHGFVSAGMAKGLNVNRIMTGDVDFTARFTIISLAALIGGTTSELTGGKFGNGAITAAMAQALNGEGVHDEIARERLYPVDYNGMEQRNPNIKRNLQALRYGLTTEGFDAENYPIIVTGGESYIDLNGDVISFSNSLPVTDSRGYPDGVRKGNSAHNIENGSRAVDLRGLKIDPKTLYRIIETYTNFNPPRGLNYSDSHIHLRLLDRANNCPASVCAHPLNK